MEKKTKLEHDVDVDRISELPDSILCKILSFLPTKNAFATSVLSTRWNSLFPFWTPPITLDFDDSLFLNPRNYQLFPLDNQYYHYDRFTDFVDEILSDVPSLDVLILNCHNANRYGYGNIVDWVNEAIRLHVRELLLDVYVDDVVTDGDEEESLFCCLDGCMALTRLKLGKEFCFSVPNNFTLPNLKSLILFALDFYDDVISEMITACPVLEELCLDNCETKECGRIRIQSHLLKKLTIEQSWNESECELIIDAPNLETLVYDDTVAGSFSVSKFRSLRMAHISLGQLIRKGEDFVAYVEDGLEDTEIYLDEFDDGLKQSWFDCVAKLIEACSSTSQLYLGSCSIEALHESSKELPEFQELSSLTIDRVWGSKGWALLARLLSKSPNLEKLIIKEGLSSNGYSSFESLSVSPPVCLELQLKEIDFWLSEVEEDELKLVEYLLKHGNVVQKLTLKCLPFKKDSSRSRLSILQGHSKIAFQPRYNRN